MATIDQAMVLCAGYGTRLRPLTDELPKPLVPIGDRSLLAHIAAGLRRAGVAKLIVNSHHLPEAIERAARDLDATVIHEPEILGTAGGVANAAEHLGAGDALVINGDILAELDLADLWLRHQRDSPFATVAVAALGPAGSGTMGIGANGELVRLRGECFGEEQAGADFVGAQILSPGARERLPARGCLVADLYLPALRAGSAIAAASVARQWWDIGTPSAYLAANLAWLADRGVSCWSAEGIDPGVALDQTIVGAGASVAGGGALRRVVVWPGAAAHAPLEDAIVTPRQTISAR